MSNRKCVITASRASGIAVLIGLISLCSIDIGPAAEHNARIPGRNLPQPIALQNVPLLSQPLVANASEDQKRSAIEAFDLSPAVFVENKGQWDPQIRYGFEGKGTTVSFTDAGLVFQMLNRDGETGKVSQAVFSATFVGAGKVKPTGLDKSPNTTNYYTGKDSSKWQSSVPSFQKVLYRGIYDGVDLYTWGRRSGLKYEFHVAPGASWERIVVRYDGIEGLSIDKEGALHVSTPLGEIIDAAPVAYQETAAGRVEIAARYTLLDRRSYGFEITGSVDPSLPLVIDPSLAFASYLGGSGYDEGRGIGVDASGNLYVTGDTRSPNFPTPGGFDTSYNGGDVDVFVAKVTSSGQLAWASYLGGSGADYGRGIAVDPSGNCYVTGYTDSPDFPTPGGFDTSFSGAVHEAFVAKVTSSGSLEWASYLGGSRQALAEGIALDASGDCYITGSTRSLDFPTPFGFDATTNGDDGNGAVFVAKVTSSGQLAWVSYFGGGLADIGEGIAVDASGNSYVTGWTYSSDFPTPGGFDTTFNDGQSDAFVAKVTSSGQFAWASYLGGSHVDQGFAIAVDASGNSYVTGRTASPDFPTPGGFDTTFNAYVFNAFLAKVTSAGQLAWASYLGGSRDDEGFGIAVDASSNCYVTGNAGSSDFPTPGGFDTSCDTTLGGGDAFVAVVTSSGQLTWASFLGGNGGDTGNAIAVDASRNCYIAGFTWSNRFPTPGGFDTTYNGDSSGVAFGDAFVATIWPGPWTPDPLVITTTALPGGTVGVAYSAEIEAVGGVTPYDWSVSSGTLPAGLSLDSFPGVIHGTPATAGTSWFTVKTTDYLSTAVAAALSIEVQPAPLVVTTTGLPGVVVGSAYSAMLAASGGVTPYAWSVSSGTLPAGLSLHSGTGIIDGTPTTLGTSDFTVTVTDTLSATASKPLSIEIQLAPLVVTTTGLPSGAVGAAYRATLAATGGVTPYAWSVSAGALPAGLSLDSSSGVIDGTPTTLGTSAFIVTVTDDLSTTDSKALSIEVYLVELVITTTALPVGAVDAAYSTTLAGSGGVPPYAWSVSSGTLPAGLSLDSSTGVIDGTPTTAGTYEFSVQVTDDWAATASKALSIEVLPVDLPIEMDPSWLEITRFRMGLPPSSGRDSFVLEGRFNLWPNANAPETVRLNIDNWSLVVDAASWKRAGNSSVYTCRQGGVTCKMTYWVLGTSKCLLQFTGIRQTLRASLTNPNIVPVRLRIGTGFDQTVVANMQGENPVKLSSLRPPLFCTQSLMIRRKLNRVARDRFAYKGKLLLEQPFSPAADSLTMRIGPYAISIPAGTMAPPKKGIVKYTARTVHGRMTLRLNRKTGAFTVNAKGVDMSAVTLDTELSLSITNHPGADWTYKLLLARNKAGTLYGY